MKNIIKELSEQKNIRTNLSTLRQKIKEETAKQECQELLKGKEALLFSFLQNEDAKTRKNTALLLSDVFDGSKLESVQEKDIVQVLYKAYKQEEMLFVKASYLQALASFHVQELLPDLKDDLEAVLSVERTEENQKHMEEEVRALRKILIQYEGIEHHSIDVKGKKVSILLSVNRNQREVVKQLVEKELKNAQKKAKLKTQSVKTTKAKINTNLQKNETEKNQIEIQENIAEQVKVHPLGVWVETDDIFSIMQIRAYRELLFPISTNKLISANPKESAKEIWNTGIMELLRKLHIGEGAFYFRVEVKSPMTLEERSRFTKKLSSELENISKGQLINSTSDYEVEIRLIANKDGLFFPCLKLMTLKDRRFSYRKNAIATSIHPSTAALIMELAEKYLKEDAQIIDPFCGVGTMLIERDLKVPAKEIYATDIFGEAITYGRENARLAGERINFIHRDFMDFKHKYLFDEIITNMPLRGKKTKQEMDTFYGEFFTKTKEILKQKGIIIMYTNELGFVKKQLRLQKEYILLQETCMQTKNEFYLLIIGYKM